MPGATFEDIALRHTDPLRRATDIARLIVLELLIMLVALTDQQTARQHPHAFGPHTITARIAAGETFGLPPAIAKTLRATIRLLRAQFHITAPRAPAPAPAVPAPAVPVPAAPAARRITRLPVARPNAIPHRPPTTSTTGTTPPSPRAAPHPASRSPPSENTARPKHPTTPNSFRYRNEPAHTAPPMLERPPICDNPHPHG